MKIKAALWENGWINGWFQIENEKIIFYKTKFNAQSPILLVFGAVGGSFLGIYANFLQTWMLLTGLWILTLSIAAALIAWRYFESRPEKYLEFTSEDFNDITEGKCGYKISRYPSKIIKTQDGNAHEFVITNKNLTAFIKLVNA
jgi:hypothetical protein